MKWFVLSAWLLAAATVHAADPPVFEATDYGANLADVQPDDDAWSKCLQAAIAKGGVCRIGKGTLMLTRYPAELRQEGTITENRDLHGLIIEGAGEDQTIVHGTSAKGFDVFQLNAVENLTIRDLAITAVKTSDDDTQGVNGISLTNGTAHVLIERVTVRKLPYVLKPGRFDGGKAFTVQQGIRGAASSTDIEIRDCTVEDSPIGFGLDADPNQKVLPGKIRVRDNRFERVSLGFSLSFSSKNMGGADVPGFDIEITGNKLVDAARVLFIGRAPDVVFTGNTVETNELPELPDPILHAGIPLVIIGGPRARIEGNVIEYQPKIPAMALIGGASGGVAADQISLSKNRLTGPAEVGLKALNNGITNGRFAGNTLSGAAVDYDKEFADRTLKNSWQRSFQPSSRDKE